MLPGLGKMDPRQMTRLMAQMGIKNEEVQAERVVIEKKDGGRIVVENPSVTAIEMGGQKSFQVAGEVREEEGGAGGGAGGGGSGAAGGQSDAELVMKEAGCSREEAEKALADAGGDIAEAILALEKRAGKG